MGYIYILVLMKFSQLLFLIYNNIIVYISYHSCSNLKALVFVFFTKILHTQTHLGQTLKRFCGELLADPVAVNKVLPTVKLLNSNLFPGIN